MRKRLMWAGVIPLLVTSLTGLSHATATPDPRADGPHLII